MGLYKIKVTLVHMYRAEVDYMAEVEAEDLDEAEDKATKEAKNKCYRSSFDAEHDETYVDNTDLIKYTPAPGDPDIPVRCNETIDMFSR